MQPARTYIRMHRLKPAGRVIGIMIVAFLALIGLLSLTRGTPLTSVVHTMGGRAPTVADSSFRDLTTLFSGVRLEPGNRVQQLLDGNGTYPLLWADLRSARQTITVQNYYSKPGAVADTLAAILSERARAGVRVLLLLDAFGSQSLKKSWTEPLERAGVTVVEFRKLKWYAIQNANYRSHVRSFVVDGRIGYTGGFGLADYWLGDGKSKDQWRETNVRSGLCRPRSRRHGRKPPASCWWTIGFTRRHPHPAG
jgi:cardiolipin synthase